MFRLNSNVLKSMLFVIVGGSSCSALAGTMGGLPVSQRSYVAALSVGPAWQSNGETQTFNLTPEIIKTYVANKSSSVFVDAELFLGMQRTLNNSFVGQLGLAVAATTTAQLHGIIWDDADPQFNNYTYSYKVQHTHVAVKGKLLAERGYIVTPWVSASVGVGFNDASDFRNVPLIFEAIPNANFTSHTSTAFTYTVGFGVQKSLSTNWQVGVGYEFADWGKSNLGRAPGQTLNSGLSLNHMYTNGVMLNLTCVV